jgi:hypothetical protein
VFSASSQRTVSESGVDVWNDHKFHVEQFADVAEAGCDRISRALAAFREDLRPFNCQARILHYGDWPIAHWPNRPNTAARRQRGVGGLHDIRSIGWRPLL